MKKGEETEVCSLVEKVFNEFVAPEYGMEGRNEFCKFANPNALAKRISPEQLVVVAKQGSEIVGIIEILKHNHISMLFVSLRGRGIAKELFRIAIEECRKRQPNLKRISVNSSTYAEPIYQKMGFKSTGPIQEKNGITFVPMAYYFE